jgi:hypothetical protein
MARDFRVNEDWLTEWNSVGDIEDVRGPRAIRQGIAITIKENVGLDAPMMEATAIEQRRGTIERVVRQSALTRSPVRVRVDEIDYDNKTVVYAISTARVELPLEIADE